MVTMKLRIFTEPQQGATYDDLLAVAQTAERLGFDAFFRSDHYLRIGAGDPGAGSDRRLDRRSPGLARETSTIRLGTLVTAGHLPAARPAGDQRGPGRPDERRPGRARPRHRLVRRRAHRLRHPVPADRRAVRPLRGAARDHHRALDHARGRDVLVRGRRTTGWRTRPRCPSPCSARSRRSSSAAAGPSARPRLAARFADEYNLPFHPLDDTAAAFDRVRQACEADGREPIRSLRRADRLRRRATTPRSRAGPRPSAATRAAARERAGGHARRGGRQDRRVRRGWAPSGSTCRCSTCPTWTTWSSSPPRSCPTCRARAVGPHFILKGRRPGVRTHAGSAGPVARRDGRTRRRRSDVRGSGVSRDG